MKKPHPPTPAHVNLLEMLDKHDWTIMQAVDGCWLLNSHEVVMKPIRQTTLDNLTRLELVQGVAMLNGKGMLYRITPTGREAVEKFRRDP